MKKHLLPAFLALPLAAALLLSACGGKKNVKTAEEGADMTASTDTMPAVDVADGAETISPEGDIRGGEFQAQEGLKAVTFDYDKYELSDEVRMTLQANAALLKVRKEWTVLVEGHCDERGTTEYNLALGQKRAKSVRDYYVRLGVPEGSIGTISYGEEMPACSESTEDCWKANRRAETKVKAK